MMCRSGSVSDDRGDHDLHAHARPWKLCRILYFCCWFEGAGHRVGEQFAQVQAIEVVS
jgi:hypothetical protein